MEGLLVPVVNFMKATEGKNRVLRLEDTSKSSKGHLSVVVARTILGGFFGRSVLFFDLDARLF